MVPDGLSHILGHRLSKGVLEHGVLGFIHALGRSVRFHRLLRSLLPFLASRFVLVLILRQYGLDPDETRSGLRNLLSLLLGDSKRLQATRDSIGRVLGLLIEILHVYWPMNLNICRLKRDTLGPDYLLHRFGEDGVERSFIEISTSSIMNTRQRIPPRCSYWTSSGFYLPRLVLVGFVPGSWFN